ncbi:hypothetical protein RRG08_024720 [Elysia crispata]|uniref:Uncharacterized protein n=1 Tax=Elysia crispata TaxID=231223 RepID=A0AAE0YDE3_9GAST|nr:hypothetical protein RRG08_024720 [Elysia crispata]
MSHHFYRIQTRDEKSRQIFEKMRKIKTTRGMLNRLSLALLLNMVNYSPAQPKHQHATVLSDHLAHQVDRGMDPWPLSRGCCRTPQGGPLATLSRMLQDFSGRTLDKLESMRREPLQNVKRMVHRTQSEYTGKKLRKCNDNAVCKLHRSGERLFVSETAERKFWGSFWTKGRIVLINSWAAQLVKACRKLSQDGVCLSVKLARVVTCRFVVAAAACL